MIAGLGLVSYEADVAAAHSELNWIGLCQPRISSGHFHRLQGSSKAEAFTTQRRDAMPSDYLGLDVAFSFLNR